MEEGILLMEVAMVVAIGVIAGMEGILMKST